MSEQLANKDILFFQAYNVRQPNDTYDFVIETGDSDKTTKGETKKPRNAKANQNIVGLIKVPHPPRLSMEDILKPRNDKCGKVKVPNKFFIYRKWYTKCLTDHNMKNDQTSISPQISAQWHSEPKEVKEYYGALSKRASELFIEIHGKEGIKSKNPNKPKNKKKAEKTTTNELFEIKPKIKEENLNSIEHPNKRHQPQCQPHLSNNFIACAFPDVPSSHLETLPLSLFQSQSSEQQPLLLFNQPPHPVQPSQLESLSPDSLF
ncbi:hypothetical protein Glove_606g45 [Diversispora epigaea]|uniref:HMG box domain-containing protein n=1 Tax=Diversispora epigaea TaxID=1348612 RepID=A0A397GBR5_9GLOM|nr:hypothetical protein Glove_606g45 [Diversispora epigaea]